MKLWRSAYPWGRLSAPTEMCGPGGVLAGRAGVFGGRSGHLPTSRAQTALTRPTLPAVSPGLGGLERRPCELPVIAYRRAAERLALLALCMVVSSPEIVSVYRLLG